MKNTFWVLILAIYFVPNLHAQSLYDLDVLRSLYIEFENDNWNTLLIDNWYAENGERELASLSMDGISYDSVAIRYKGNATFFWANETDNPKKPLNIDMNNYISDQELLGFKKVKLASSFFDPSMLRDVLGLKIYGNYMPSPEANWMKVFIEDDYIGLFSNTEAINKQFLKKHFNFKKGALFKCDPAGQYPSDTGSSDLAWQGEDSTLYYNRYDLKSDNGWAELVNLIDVLNNSPQNLESILNIDRVLWYLAVSTVTANYDSYNGFYMHNYYLYLHENGLFQMLPWDLSETFVCSLADNGIVEGDAIYEWDIFNENDPFEQSRPLVDYVVNHPLYKKQYLAHIRTVIDEVLDEADLLAECQDMQSIIADAVADDSNAFFGLGNSYFEFNLTSEMNDWGLEVAGIIPTVEKRKLYLENHPEVSLSPPTIAEVSRSIDSPQAGEQVVVSAMIENGTTIDLMITTNEYASHFEAIPMLDDGMHGDGLSGDGIYGAFIPFTNLNDEIKYYIRAQNADAIMLDPQRAEYEFHEYVVGQMTSSVSLIENQEEASITPNPFSDRLNIQLENGNLHRDILIQVYSVRGDLLISDMVKFVNQQYSLQLTELNTGIYILYVDGYRPYKIVKD